MLCLVYTYFIVVHNSLFAGLLLLLLLIELYLVKDPWIIRLLLLLLQLLFLVLMSLRTFDAVTHHNIASSHVIAILVLFADRFLHHW